MNKYYFLLVFFLIILSNTSFAQQNGYVITQKNDTLKCKVWIPKFGGVKYQLNEQGESIRIKTDDIKEYELTGDDSCRYRAVSLKPGKKPEFLQMIEHGRISLYLQTITNYSNNISFITTNWYASKDQGEIVLLKTSSLNFFGSSRNKRKNELADMFSDQPKIAAEYKADDNLSYKNIQKYVHEYNLAATVNK